MAIRTDCRRAAVARIRPRRHRSWHLPVPQGGGVRRWVTKVLGAVFRGPE